MKSVFVHSFANLKEGKPFKNERRNESFSVLMDAALKNNVETYLSNYENYYNRSSKCLARAWSYDGKWKKIKDKKVGLVFYHGKNSNSLQIEKELNLPVVNFLPLEKICDDKLSTTVFFPKLSPKTFLINNHYELNKALKLIRTDKIVLKPRFGSYGRGVFIYDKHELKNGIMKDTLVQEFIDSSNGIPSSTIKKPHDIRIIIIDGKIDHCYIRVPKKNKFICNMNHGAKKIFVGKEDIPKEILKKVRYIDNKFKDLPSRVYSADFLFDKNKKPWLIEMNSKPGTLYYDGAKKIRKKFYFNVFKSLKKLL